MKLTTIFTTIAMLSSSATTLANPVPSSVEEDTTQIQSEEASMLLRRQSPAAQVDNLQFGISLPAFTSRRNARNPPQFDWQSDGCTSSPDRPFGWNFLPACHRHDFGYHNFRLQNRFTESNKARIDNQFLTDLKFQCASVSRRGACESTAQVYYAAVRQFGGDDATPGKKRSSAAEPFKIKVEVDGVEETVFDNTA